MISVTILTKNCEATLEATLASLRDFPEVLLYDTGSTDATLTLARRFPNVRIIEGPFIGFGPTHNAASKLATHDWILSIDGDEVLSPALSQEILSLKLDPGCVYKIERHNFLNHKRIRCCGGWHPDPVIRLYNRQSTRFSEDAVHEQVVKAHLKVCPLSSPLLHTPYRSVEDFLHKMQLYSTLFAQQHRGKKKSSLFKALLHGWGSFIKNYLLKWGVLGGKEGFFISLYNAQTTFYKYLKLHELNKLKK